MYMNENPITYGRDIEGEVDPRPTTLDIVKVDGRLYQSLGSDDSEFTALDLSNMQLSHFNFDDYNLDKIYDMPIGDLMETGEMDASDSQIDNIHYDSRNKNNHDAKKWGVTVFGEYTKKPE
jgi:hypothetical protein